MDNEKYYVEDWGNPPIPPGVRARVGFAQHFAGPDRLGLVKIYTPGITEDIIIMSRRDFERWFGKLPEGGTK